MNASPGAARVHGCDGKRRHVGAAGGAREQRAARTEGEHHALKAPGEQSRGARRRLLEGAHRLAGNELRLGLIRDEIIRAGETGEVRWQRRAPG